MSIKDTSIRQYYADGEAIITEGIMSNNAYVVLKGSVRVTKKIDKNVVAVGTLNEEDVFGEMGLLSKSVRTANVSAMGDVTVGVIDKEYFDEAMNGLSEDLKPIILSLVERLKITTELLTRIGLELETTRNKINSYSLKEK